MRDCHAIAYIYDLYSTLVKSFCFSIRYLTTSPISLSKTPRLSKSAHSYINKDAFPFDSFVTETIKPLVRVTKSFPPIHYYSTLNERL